MQRINSIYDWQLLDDGMQLNVASDVADQRLVKIRVNAPSPVALYLKVADAEDPIFLARVEGLDDIWFNVQGDYKLLCMGSFCMVDTLDGTKAHVDAVSPDSFTVISERQAIDPAVQYITMKMQENFERRMAAQAATFDAALADLEARREADRAVAEAAGGNSQEQNPGQVSSDPPAGDVSGAAGGEPDA